MGLRVLEAFVGPQTTDPLNCLVLSREWGNGLWGLYRDYDTDPSRDAKLTLLTEDTRYELVTIHLAKP